MKVGIIGCGFVGSTAAYAMALMNTVSEIVMVGRVLLTSKLPASSRGACTTRRAAGGMSKSVGYGSLTDNLGSIQQLCWKTRIATVYQPEDVTIRRDLADGQLRAS